MKPEFPPLALALACGACLIVAAPAFADKIKHPTATFNGLDKITGRIIAFDVAINETVQFGSLQITPRVCFSRPLTEAPQTDAFAEVDEVVGDKTYNRIFSGWMFADSPGLHGVEHPVYDIWLTDCKGDGPLIHEAPVIAEAPPPDDDFANPDATAPATPTPDAKPTPKKRKPKPVAQQQAAPTVESAPLDLAPPSGPSSRAGPTRRFFPAEAAPVPPADIGQ
jgi:hypothetical protein